MSLPLQDARFMNMQIDRKSGTMLAMVFIHCFISTAIFFKKIVVSLIITVYVVVTDSSVISPPLAVKPGRLAIYKTT